MTAGSAIDNLPGRQGAAASAAAVALRRGGLNIHFISAALPPALDGIGDYTALLAAEAAKSARVKILAARAAVITPIEGVEIVPCFDWDVPASNWELLGRVREEAPDWVVLQYNPFSFGRRGLNLQLPRVVAHLRRHTNVAVMFHERYFQPVRDWRTAAMAGWQRWQFRQLARAADVAFFSTDVWAAEFARSHRRPPAFHLPVGSNIPRMPADRDAVRRELGFSETTVVVGMFGSAHVSRLLSWVRDAAAGLRQGGRDAAVLYLGGDVERVRQAMDGAPLRCTGALEPSGVSRYFSAIDVYACPFADGVSTRRGSFLIGLEHGTPTVTTGGESTGELLRSWAGKGFLMSPCGSVSAFTAAVRQVVENRETAEKLAKEGRALFNSVFSWEKIAARLLAALEQCKSERRPEL